MERIGTILPRSTIHALRWASEAMVFRSDCLLLKYVPLLAYRTHTMHCTPTRAISNANHLHLPYVLYMNVADSCYIPSLGTCLEAV